MFRGSDTPAGLMVFSVICDL